MKLRQPGLIRRAVRFFCALALIGALMLVTAGSATAQSKASPRAHGHRPFSVAAARWWQWALTQPAATSPLLDQTGEFCAEGQKGHVWYLAGPAGGGQTLTRTCTVPAGKDLFFPLANAFNGATAGDADQSVAAQRALVALYDPRHATNLSLTIDGRRALRLVHYEESVVFTVVLPDGNIFGADAGTVVSPTVDAGYYAYVRALRPGEHVIHFTGQLPSSPDGPSPGLVDVTYHLTVSKH